jgi:hypothetical protein
VRPELLGCVLRTLSPDRRTPNPPKPSINILNPDQGGAVDGYIGCYSDSTSARTLRHVLEVASSGMTSQRCQALAAEAGFSVFGLGGGNMCWADDAAPGASLKAATGDCSAACTGDASQSCGGALKLSVFTRAVGAA